MSRRLLAVAAAASLLLPGQVLAQGAPSAGSPFGGSPSGGSPVISPAQAPAETQPASPVLTPPVNPTPASPTPAAGKGASGSTKTPEQAVLERIRRLRDGDSRRFGSCTYRWDRWRLLADGTRTTNFSCDRAEVASQLVGVNCAKLQINVYTRVQDVQGQPERWTWGTWRLPAAGGEEQMVASLCANVLPNPTPAANPSAGSSASSPSSSSTKPSATPSASQPATKTTTPPATKRAP